MSLEKKIKKQAGHSDMVFTKFVLEELRKDAQKIRDMLYLTRVRCKNCAQSDEPYCEICAKEVLALLVEDSICPNCKSTNVHKPRVKAKGTKYECLSCGETW